MCATRYNANPHQNHEIGREIAAYTDAWQNPTHEFFCGNPDNNMFRVSLAPLLLLAFACSPTAAFAVRGGVALATPSRTARFGEIWGGVGRSGRDRPR